MKERERGRWEWISGRKARNRGEDSRGFRITERERKRERERERERRRERERGERKRERREKERERGELKCKSLPEVRSTDDHKCLYHPLELHEVCVCVCESVSSFFR